MNLDENQITEMVLNALNNLKQDHPDLTEMTVDKSTLLLAEGSLIDSLTLVSLVVDIESVLANKYNFDVSLTDDRAMTREISPFYNVANLVDYIMELKNMPE